MGRTTLITKTDARTLSPARSQRQTTRLAHVIPPSPRLMRCPHVPSVVTRFRPRFRVVGAPSTSRRTGRNVGTKWRPPNQIRLSTAESNV
ncbi:hypothetical protein BHM03_00006335 [Ensete ventricosum]|nr:hypothetical protein BHM03_00006335 [Ensete ventricosum]